MADLLYDEETGTWAFRQMLRSPYIDYSNGRFFVTFQVAHNKSAFGAIVGETCVLNELGESVKAAWLAEPEHVAGLEIFDFVVMPNHFHAIVEYHEPTGRSGPVATSGIRSGPLATSSDRSGPVATCSDRATAPGRFPAKLYFSRATKPTGRSGPAASSGDRATAPGRFTAPSKYSRDPHARDLPYVIGLFKSYTTTLYHRLKAAGRCVDIGPTLWQASFYDELIRSDLQYRETAHYILRNPANWNSDRFGAVTSYAEGNLALLQCEYVAYMSSEGREDAPTGRSGPVATSGGRSGPVATSSDRSGPVATSGGRSGPVATSSDRATAPGRFPAKLYFSRATKPTDRSGPVATCVDRGPTGRIGPASGDRATAPGRCGSRPVISTFTSYYERQLLARCLATKRRFIWVLPGGISAAALEQTAAARAAGDALLISPTAPGTGVNKQRAIWCNQFIAKNAREIWIGHLRRGGSLETILKATTAGVTARETPRSIS